MENRNEAIIKKIKGLLAIANDNQNDEESQSAFIMAQKLMLKYDISIGEIESKAEKDTIEDGQVTAYKKLYWWEATLSQIISKNFRVKTYYNVKGAGSRNPKKAILFLGYKQDVELAREMFILAYDVLTHYSKRYVNEQYKNVKWRDHSFTAELKKSYILGFLVGMEKRFKEQVQQMEQEYGLMVLTPKEVENEFKERFEGLKPNKVKIPPIEEAEAYRKGYHDGNNVDYTKSLLDGEFA